jgi:hypothetical protein
VPWLLLSLPARKLRYSWSQGKKLTCLDHAAGAPFKPEESVKRNNLTEKRDGLKRAYHRSEPGPHVNGVEQRSGQGVGKSGKDRRESGDYMVFLRISGDTGERRGRLTASRGEAFRMAPGSAHVLTSWAGASVGNRLASTLVAAAVMKDRP